MPADSRDTVPVLIHVDRKEWLEFRKRVGYRKASQAVRKLVRQDNAQNRR
jgi:hypothetical protein